MSTLGDVGHKNGIRVELYFGEVRGVLGVESGVNAIILLGGSQASPDRPSDHNTTKKKSLHCLETGAQDLNIVVNVKCLISYDNMVIFRGRCLILMVLNKGCCINFLCGGRLERCCGVQWKLLADLSEVTYCAQESPMQRGMYL
jgi:hypothetical protein